MEFNLLFHNIGFAFDAVAVLAISFFIFLKDRKSTASITLILALVSSSVFAASHVIGVNIPDPNISRLILMGNISIIFIGVFMAHSVFAAMGDSKKQKFFLVFIYISAIVLSLIYIIFPDSFLLPSVPKMYFPNYYVPGTLHWVMRVIFSIIVPVYFIAYLIFSYKAADTIARNRIKYFLTSLALGYGFGSMAIPLVYNIQINPLWATPFVPIWAIPFAYAVLKYNLMDIRIIAKRALIVGSIVAISSFVIFVFGYVNYLIVVNIPQFPSWIMPLIAGCMATTTGVIVWSRFRETDVLKYEFITVVTHKLRTPLTSIKWSAENLANSVPKENIDDLNHIKTSAEHLMELVDILADVSSEYQGLFLYHWKKLNFASFYEQLAETYKKQAAEKNISLSVHNNISPESAYIKADEDKIKSVFQILIGNALMYTPKSGSVNMFLDSDGNSVIVSIRDSGIGIDKSEMRLIFSSFYRTEMARRSDTEGMGVGLYLAKKIVEQHNGHIWAHSEGKGKGSTFYVSLPIEK